jgi:hypothetical protein
VPAADEVSREVDGWLGEEGLDDPGIDVWREAAFPKPGIDAEALVVAGLADQGEKVSFAATNLEDLLAANAIELDQTVDESLRKRGKRGRKPLTFLVVLRVVEKGGIKETILDEAAGLAEAELEVTSGETDRLRMRAQ